MFKKIRIKVRNEVGNNMGVKGTGVMTTIITRDNFSKLKK